MPDTVYTKEDLREQLRQMGLKPTDTVLIHSSMKAVGEVEGGAEHGAGCLDGIFFGGTLASVRPIPGGRWVPCESYPE